MTHRNPSTTEEPSPEPQRGGSSLDRGEAQDRRISHRVPLGAKEPDAHAPVSAESVYEREDQNNWEEG